MHWSRSPRLPTIVLITGFVSLSTGWFFSSPIGAAPDEEAHYVRAVGISEGRLVGDPITFSRGSESVAALNFYEGVSRAIWVPARLDPPDFAGCYAARSAVSAACADGQRQPDGPAYLLTYVGVYPPIPYLLPALLLRFASNPWVGVYLGRLGIAVTDLLLVAMAILALGYGRTGSLRWVGLFLAATPMVVFLGVSLSPSGVEVAAALCLLAALIRLRGLSDQRPPMVMAIALAAGGFALAAARPLGPLWVAFALLGYLLAGGQVNRHHRRTIVAARLVFAGIGSTVLWDLVNTPLASFVSLGGGAGGDWKHTLSLAVGGIYQSLQEQVGWFGWVDTPLPTALYVIWFAAVLGLLAIAMAVGSNRERLLLAGLSVGSFVAMVLLAALVFIPIGQNSQGRYTMAATLAIPMWAAEVVYQNREKVRHELMTVLPALVILGVSITQLLAWWINARRYAVGVQGPVFFLVVPGAWQPPLGWWPWLGFAVLGSACLAATALLRPANSGRAITAS
jgi:hypothetical protein